MQRNKLFERIRAVRVNDATGAGLKLFNRPTKLFNSCLACLLKST